MIEKKVAVIFNKPGQEEAIENLACYFVRAFLSSLLQCTGGGFPRRR
jgi:hypothetical protein